MHMLNDATVFPSELYQQRLIPSKINVFVYMIEYVCVHLSYIYKYTHIFKKNMLFILNIFIYNTLYEHKYTHVNIFKIYCVCVFKYTNIIKTKLLFWM